MTSWSVAPLTQFNDGRRGPGRAVLPIGLLTICALALAGCASHPVRYASGPGGGRHYDPKLGVWASPRVVADGEPIPRGGGGYLVGRPYTIGGRSYVPSEQPEGYSVVGTASWYGDAFHGRRTANGEIFDKNSISAAHPTLPLPSYVRVTNLKNGRSMIVRVNDRGPYHGGRVMDVSQRVAESLAFKGEGTARIRVDYVGRASLAGSDDERLLATLRLDGSPAGIDGGSSPPTMVADESQDPAPPLAPARTLPAAQRVARLADDGAAPPATSEPPPTPPLRRIKAPVPPARPFEVEAMPRLAIAPASSRAAVDELVRERVARAASSPGRDIAQLRPPPRPLVSFGGTVAQGYAASVQPPRRPHLTAAGEDQDQ
jgi:rare lipoprotein A